jgi:hypothetical protein
MVKKAIYIQRTWRAILLRRTKGNPNRIVRLQYWWRARFGKRRFKMFMQARRAGEELSKSGAQLLVRTTVCVYQEQMWGGVTKKGFAGEVKREIQRIFANSSPQGQLELSKVTKMIRDCPGLMGKGSIIDSQRVDLMFSKVKGPNDKKLVYPKFVELLFVLGGLKFGVSHEDIPIVNTGPSSRRKGKGKAGSDVKATSVEKGEGKDSEGKEGKEDKDDKEASKLKKAVAPPVQLIECNKFRFGRLKGRAAVVCKFIDVYLSKTNDFRRAVTELKLNSCANRTTQKIEDTVLQLQRWLKTRHSIRRLNRFKLAVYACVLRSKQNKAAAVIQSMGRSWLGRLLLIRMAQRMYVKYMDSAQNPPREYWFNPRTGHAMWTKPLLLGDKDCGAATKVPEPDEGFEVYCGICVEQTAVLRCEDCDEPHSYCSSCYNDTHASESRRVHCHLEYSRCVQCDFQMSSRLCDQCGDLYCDTCYNYMHRKGRYRIHTFTWTTPMCTICEQRAAQWERRTEDTDFVPVHACVPCLKATYGEDPTNDDEELGLPAMPWLKRLDYLGHSVVQHRAAVAAARRRKEIEELDALRKEIRFNKVRYEAAREIQRRWRSVALRHAPWFVAYCHQRRQFFELRELEQPLRDGPLYKARLALGLPMKLASDTPVEMLDMLYGKAMLAVVEESVEFNLKKAYGLAREQALWQWSKAVADAAQANMSSTDRKAAAAAEKARLEKEKRAEGSGSDEEESEDEETEAEEEESSLLEMPNHENDKASHSMHHHEDLEVKYTAHARGRALHHTDIH